jgi:hypothetical protein
MSRTDCLLAKRLHFVRCILKNSHVITPYFESSSISVACALHRMSTESIHHPLPPSRPSTSLQNSDLPNGKRRSAPSFEDNVLPLSDHNSWYYPSQGHDSDDEELNAQGGNWGNKDTKNSRWVRRGKMTAWGPGMDDWEASLNHWVLKALD